MKSAFVFCLVLLFVCLSESKLYKKDYVGALNQRLHRHQLLGSSPTEPKPQWFTQQLDHFDQSNTKTWQQRYFVNDTYYTAGGPVFLMLGGEGPVSGAYVTDHFITASYAQRTGGLMVALEHRFYGDSLTNDTSTPMLRYLSSEQALADAAVFRGHIQQQYSLPDATKWIVMGGSYSGCLSAWLKLKYPHLFAGSLASSGPVLAKVDFLEYFEVVQQSVGDICAARIRAAVTYAEILVMSPAGRSSLQSMFNTCTPIVTDNDVSMFFEALSDPIAGIVQYNDDNNKYQPMNITQMCNILNHDADPLVALSELVKQINAFQNTTCVEVDYNQYIKDMQATTAGRSWTYQTCVEFGFYQTGESANQPFSKYISLPWFLNQCKDIFGADLVPNTNWTNTNYGNLQITTSNTFFTNGLVDPWHALGVLTPNHGPGTETVVINGTAHCADLYPARDADLPDLTVTRTLQFEAIQRWLQ